MLAALFLLSIWFDDSQPSIAPRETYGLLMLYLGFALGLAALIWRNWWLDARLGGPAHLIDMAMFTAIVFSTNGYTSPFYLLFVLPLLSAAIRWGWRATAFTALALVSLYMCAGIFVAGSTRFELQRFIVRSGHLVILSLMLMWFGIHQAFTRLLFPADEFDPGTGSSQEAALRLAMNTLGARRGLIMVNPRGVEDLSSLALGTDLGPASPALIPSPPFARAFLFDIAHDRALARMPSGRSRFGRASAAFDPVESERLGIGAGVAARIDSATTEGWLILWDITDLSADYCAVATELAETAGALLDRDALLASREDAARVATRLSLARDVHDNVVQFLAGATFRVEAISRASKSGTSVQDDVEELKRLLVQEQQDIRDFIAALRHDRDLDMDEVADELRTLAGKLGRQWSIACTVHEQPSNEMIPVALHLDVQQIMREAVANAAKHGGADRIDVRLALADGQLHLDVEDNGKGFEARNDAAPMSLKERTERAHGSISVSSVRGRTKVHITLPVAGGPA